MLKSKNNLITRLKSKMYLEDTTEQMYEEYLAKNCHTLTSW